MSQTIVLPHHFLHQISSTSWSDILLFLLSCTVLHCNKNCGKTGAGKKLIPLIGQTGRSASCKNLILMIGDPTEAAAKIRSKSRRFFQGISKFLFLGVVFCVKCQGRQIIISAGKFAWHNIKSLNQGGWSVEEN